MTVIKNSYRQWLLCCIYEFLISILSSLSLLAVGMLIFIKYIFYSLNDWI